MNRTAAILDRVAGQRDTHLAATALEPAACVLTRYEFETLTRGGGTIEEYESIRAAMACERGTWRLFGMPVMIIDVPSVTK